MVCKLCNNKIGKEKYRIGKGCICGHCYELQPSVIKKSIRHMKANNIEKLSEIITSAKSKPWGGFLNFMLCKDSIRINDWEIKLSDISAVKFGFKPLCEVGKDNQVYGDIFVQIGVGRVACIIEDVIGREELIYSISGKNIYYKRPKNLNILETLINQTIQKGICDTDYIKERMCAKNKAGAQDKTKKSQEEEARKNSRNRKKSDEKTFSLDSAKEMYGVVTPFTEAQLKKKYRELVKKHHPDQGGTALMFSKVQSAYEILLKSVAA
ncbi:MAG: J domain-containing protein [Lachnospiraceae bacterium]|nr:J domain-containing protein [Lachnospiraceae bacterium]